MACRLFYFKYLICMVICVLSLSACKAERDAITASPVAMTPSITASQEVSPSPSPLPPTATPVPLAALVNGTAITLEEFQVELALFQAASGREASAEDQKLVLDDLINQVLLMQGAQERNFTVDEALLQERIQQLASQLGGEEALKNWMTAHSFSAELFRRALSRSIEAAWMRDQIITGLPKTAEQVHARQILLYQLEDATQVLAQLQAGSDFTNLAKKYDPLTGGDLGWFPRGYLLDPKLEEVAFNLQPNQYSPVIQTLAGFHILQVIERDPARPLTPEALLILQTRAVQTWLAERRGNSEIQILLPLVSD